VEGAYIKKGQHHSAHLQLSWNKHGERSFEFSTIEATEKQNCIIAEQMWFDLLTPEFNILKTAGSPLGFRHSEEAKKKIRLASMGNKSAVGNTNNRGRVYCKEIRTKMSLAHIGNSHRKGVKASDETRERMSNSHNGKKLSPETIAKMSLSHIGKTTALGHKHSDEARAKISSAGLGRKYSEEARENMRLAWVKRRKVDYFKIIVEEIAQNG
jgi:group I intron endonuclease